METNNPGYPVAHTSINEYDHSQLLNSQVTERHQWPTRPITLSPSVDNLSVNNPLVEVPATTFQPAPRLRWLST